MASPAYSFRTISVPGAAGTYASDINSSGDIAGGYSLTDPSTENIGAQGFLLRQEVSPQSISQAPRKLMMSTSTMAIAPWARTATIVEQIILMCEPGGISAPLPLRALSKPTLTTSITL